MHQPTLRVIQVLEQIAKDSSGKRLTDLSRELQIPKSTLLPILQTLCAQKYLSQDDLGRYVPGTSLFSLGSTFSDGFPVLQYVREQLQLLVGKLNETCFFGALEDGYVLYLEKVECTQPLRMLTGVGHRLPAYATAIGKALLSNHTEDQLRELYPNGLTPLTPHTVDSIEDLYRQLQQVQLTGYAWECEESTPHVRCFAVPVRKNGVIVSAISVTIPLFRYEESHLSHILTSLRATAGRMSSVLEQTNAHFGDLF